MGFIPQGARVAPSIPSGPGQTSVATGPAAKWTHPCPPRGFSGGEEGAVLSTMAGWGGGLKAFKVINEIHISGATCLSETIPGWKTLEKQVFVFIKMVQKG